jgi:hypothetical protein
MRPAGTATFSRPRNDARPARPNDRGPNDRAPNDGGPRHSGPGSAGKSAGPGKRSGDEHEILFQQFFKSVGPRTYAAQVKRAKNGNHYLVLMEGKRDEKTNEIRKTRLFVFSEDFVEFFKLIKASAEFVKANPVPREVKQKREKFWQKQSEGPKPALAS